MQSPFEQGIDQLTDGVDEAQGSEEFQEWLDVQSRFHDYWYSRSPRASRCPRSVRRHPEMEAIPSSTCLTPRLHSG